MMLTPIAFGIEAPNDVTTRQYFRDTNTRLQENSLGKNPYAMVKSRAVNGETFDEHYFSLRPVYPEFWLFGLFPIIVAFFPIWGWAKVAGFLVGGLTLSAAGLWTPRFTFGAIKAGAKRAGVDVRGWRLLQPNLVVERLL